MALPAAVQRQVEEAEALQQQLYAPQPAPDQPVEAPTEAVTEAAATEEAAPTNVVELPRPAEPATPSPEAPKSREEDPAYWRQRFQTVSGILDTEVPRLTAQVKEQSAQIQQLLRQLEQPKAAEQPKDGALVTSKDEEDFGSDLIDMVRRCALETVRREFAPMTAKLEKLEKELQEKLSAVAGRVEKSDADKFWDKVKTHVPDWDAIDNDPSWWEFLNTTPEFAEDSYRELAARAIQKGDATKIANLVKLWRGPVVAPVPPVPPATPTPPAAPKPELQRQVAPSTSRASAPVQPTGQIWTRADYEAAMDVRNIQRLGAAKTEKLVNAANLAVAEGRIHW